MQFLMVAQRGNAERIQSGMQMPAHAKGADHHDGAHRIARRAQHLVLVQIGAIGLRPGLDLIGDVAFDLRPVAVKSRNQFAIGRDRPVGPLPRRAARLAHNVGLVVFQLLEEVLPAGIERSRVLLVAGVEIFKIGSVAAIKERRALKRFVRLLPCHHTSRNCPQPRASYLAAPAHRTGVHSPGGRTKAVETH